MRGVFLAGLFAGSVAAVASAWLLFAEREPAAAPNRKLAVMIGIGDLWQ